MANQLFEKLFKIKKQKPAVLIAIGSTAGLAVGGAIAWWSLQQPVIEELPAGADIIPQETALTVSVSTNTGQWRQLQQFGTTETAAALNKNWSQFYDRLLSANGFDFERDIKPWVGSEMTVAFLTPDALSDSPDLQQVQPYSPDPLKGDTPPVLVLPIANPAKAQELLSKPKVAEGQEWVDRDYRGIKIREVHGKTEHAYAAAVLGNRYVVISPNSQAIDRVVDTFRGEAAIARTPGYGQAFTQLKTDSSPLLRLYVNISTASQVAANNATQPIPPQGLALLQGNQGLAASMELAPQGVEVEAISWLPGDSKVRYQVSNTAERMPNLLPASTLLMTSGGNFRQFWQNHTQLIGNDSTTGGVLNPNFLRQGFSNLTGLNLDKDLAEWMEGEFALALVSEPAVVNAANPAAGTPTKAGLLLLAQAGDRKAADESFKKLDALMQERYRFRVEAAKLGNQPVVNWISPFSSLTVTRGWLDGNVAFLAVGSGVGSTIAPMPVKSLAQNPLFQNSSSKTLTPNNGHFYLELERLANRNLSLPLPELPPENQAYLNAIRSLNVTSAIQDSRTTRYDVRMLLRRVSDSPAAPSPNATPQAAPTAAPNTAPKN
ncbi:DUF3352 domain-containing protein [Phormidium tenue FACHB-886]|nr:DUF3352 domain-containing protein [Phormidium tenue FACHB-886]